jgi:hypothetical protein
VSPRDSFIPDDAIPFPGGTFLLNAPTVPPYEGPRTVEVRPDGAPREAAFLYVEDARENRPLQPAFDCLHCKTQVFANSGVPIPTDILHGAQYAGVRCEKCGSRYSVIVRPSPSA